jgi:cytoskeletal protein CcmA (bactofilin family)
MAGESLRIKGDIIANEALSFNGHIQGTISVPEHTLIVGPQAIVDADVRARAIVVAGTLRGNASARERFELQEQGSLEGTLEAPRIHVREGALLRAKVTMPVRTAAAADAARKDATAPTHHNAEASLPVA